MASISYLWGRRAKPRLWSSQWVKAWAKRVLSFPSLTGRSVRRWHLNFQGAQIDRAAEVADVVLNGDRHNLVVGAFTFIGNVKMMLHAKIIVGERVCINDDVEIITATHDIGSKG